MKKDVRKLFVLFFIIAGLVLGGVSENYGQVENTAKGLRTLTGHTDWVRSIDISPHGKTLASGSADKTIRLWDVETGDLLETLTGHIGTVYSLRFSPDGPMLASSGADATIRFWDVETGNPVKTLTGHTDTIWQLRFDPQGKTTLASGSRDTTIRLWNTTSPVSEKSPQANTEKNRQKTTKRKADANGDGDVNVLDLVFITANFKEIEDLAADVNGDGDVNILDLVFIAARM